MLLACCPPPFDHLADCTATLPLSPTWRISSTHTASQFCSCHLLLQMILRHEKAYFVEAQFFVKSRRQHFRRQIRTDENWPKWRVGCRALLLYCHLQALPTLRHTSYTSFYCCQHYIHTTHCHQCFTFKPIHTDAFRCLTCATLVACVK